MVMAMISATPTEWSKSGEWSRVPGWLLGSLDDVTLPWAWGKVTNVLVSDLWMVSPDMDLWLRDACRLSQEGPQGSHKCPPHSKN